MTRLTVIGKQTMKVSDLYFWNKEDATKWIEGFYHTHLKKEIKQISFFEYLKSFFFEREETKKANDIIHQVKSII